MSNTKYKFRPIFAALLSVVIIGLAAWIFLNRHYVADALNVSLYRPSSAVAAIESRTEMTDKGRFIFYATKPEVLDASNFNQHCPRQEVGNPILGCYTGDDRIYIYNLTDTQLDGMKEVTAAHEMLHAVWQRTSQSDKEHLTTLLEKTYQGLNDSALKERMGYYQRTEPGEFINELHSILGTEEAGLGTELETYYAQFFDRDTVLALHDQYYTFYSELTAKADTLYDKMQQLSTSIDKRSTLYNKNAAQLSSDIDSFNTRANSGNFSSQAQFYSERAALVSRSNQLETDRTAINKDITTYNKYYAQYTEIASQIQLLNNSMDSYRSLGEAPSV